MSFLVRIRLLVWLVFLAISSVQTQADSLYDVTEITVDTTAKDAVAARQMGMEQAQMRAIYIVLKRLVPPGTEQHLPPLSKEQIESMVSGISIRKEQNSTTRYIATLDVSFNEQAVKQFLINQGIPHGEAPAPYENGAMAPEGPAGYDETPSVPPGVVPRNVAIMVEFTGLKDWQNIRSRLEQVAGIHSLEVNSLSARTAAITLDYAGSLGNLQAVLGQNGFSFGERDGIFVLRSQ